MIVILKKGATDAEMQDFIRQWEQRGYGVHILRGEETTILGLVGDTTKLNMENVIANPIVEDVKRVTAPYKMAGRAFHPDNTVIAVGTGNDAVRFGGNTVPVIAGPCSVESEEQVVAIAKAVKKAGAKLLRGGAFKPRT